MTRTLPLLAAILAMGSTAAWAAGPDDAVAAARNQLGVLEYCAGAGHVPASVAARQQAMFDRLPAPKDAATVNAAYAKGQRGVIAAMGIEQPIADAARLQGTDVAGLCRQLAARSGG